MDLKLGIHKCSDSRGSCDAMSRDVDVLPPGREGTWVVCYMGIKVNRGLGRGVGVEVMTRTCKGYVERLC